MASLFPNGTQWFVSTGFGPVVPISALSNASPAVATVSNTAALAAGDIVVVASNWPSLNEKALRLKAFVAGDATLEDFDTSDLLEFPAGMGAGSLRKVSSWVQLAQMSDINKSGGEQQFATFQYVEDRKGRQRQKPTYKNPKSLVLTMDYDPAAEWYSALEKLDTSGAPVVVKAQLPNNAILLYYAYPSFDADPSMELNKNMANKATFSMISEFTRYNS